ncbi:MAG: VWA domain-containing protein [Candidatus Acidiferrales bacterium]
MAPRYLPAFLILFGSLTGSAAWMSAQEGNPSFHVVVDMVQLNVAVTDHKGNYVTGLHPTDFLVTEDGIRQKIATFSEGNQAPRAVSDIVAEDAPPKAATTDSAQPPSGPPDSAGKVSSSHSSPDPPDSPLAGADVFVLFDTSNYMYRGFALAQDAIADFVRSLNGPDRIALYSYSRDLFRAALLTPDREQVLQGVRATTAGDDAALYNALLLTLRDAARYKGRKVVVVFSNGPDNDSLVPPEDVGELAQSEGIPIYMISTRAAKIEPISTAVFGRMAAATGGEAFFAKSWKDEQQAFSSVRDDLAHLYALNYYPQANPNRGWRAISVKLAGERFKKYHVRTRSGYRPLPAHAWEDHAVAQ